jgi:hypothetical protein
MVIEINIYTLSWSAMTDHAIPSASRSLPVQAALPWLVGAGVYVLLLALGPQLLNDPDTYSHVAVGRWILSHGAVPDRDPFSFSMHGAPWITFEWLSQIVYAAVYAISGWAGVVALTSAAIAFALGLLTRFLLRDLAPAPTLLMVVAAMALLAPHSLARPHVLVLPIIVTWAAALVRSMDRQAPPPYWALPLLVLWANLHGSVVLALGLIGPAVLESLLTGGRDGCRRVFRRWLPFAALALAACCLTPYGAKPLLMPLTTLGLGQALAWIGEWRPQDFSHLGAFEVLLLAGIFASSRGVTLPVTRILVLLGLLHFALAQVRNADLLAVLAPLYLAAPLARQFGRNADSDTSSFPYRLSLLTFAVMVSATALQMTRDPRPAAANTPAAAIASAGLADAGPVLNDYAFGGYLIYDDIPTFIDGRGELFGGHFIDRYNRDISLADLNDFLKLLDEYNIRATLLAPNTPAVALLDRLPQWQRVYGDGIAVVHKRRAISEHLGL